jgi:hypothetical protein
MTTPPATPTTDPTPSTGLLRDLLRRPALLLALATLVAGVLSVGATSPATAADTCANAALREQNNSSELPDCRAYEMVSSPYKQGFDLLPQTFSDDGIVSYNSTGSFAGNGLGLVSNQYLGVRTPAGWETRSLNPPGALYGMYYETSIVLASDLRSSIVAIEARDQPEDGHRFYVRDFNGKLTRVGQDLPDVGVALLVSFASDDLSHVVFGVFQNVIATWEYAGVGGAAVLRLVNVDNNGVTVPTGCPVMAGWWCSLLGATRLRDRSGACGRGSAGL